MNAEKPPSSGDPSSGGQDELDFMKRFEIPKYFQDSLSECSRKIEESQKQINLEFQNVDENVEDASPKGSLNYDSLIGKGLIENDNLDDLNIISMQSELRLNSRKVTDKVGFTTD